MNYILIDGDVVRYRVGFAAQKTRYKVHCGDVGEYKDACVHFDNAKEANAYMADHRIDKERREAYLEVEPVENCLHSCKILMQSIQDKYPGSEMVVYFSCRTKDNWRTRFYPQYKANRKPRRPEHVEALTEYMLKKYPCVQLTDSEADDAIAAEAAGFRNVPIPYVVVTNDKDMDQIPGQHYDFTKDLSYFVTPAEASMSLDVQIVAGDSTDNIPGIKDVGAATAMKLLAEHGDPAIVYDHAYETLEMGNYWFMLNKALVTLPKSRFAMEKLILGVTDAKKEVKGLQEISEDDDRGTDGAGTGEACTQGVEKEC